MHYATMTKTFTAPGYNIYAMMNGRLVKLTLRIVSESLACTF